MGKIKKTLNRTGNSDLGYVIIPEDVDRNEYVSTCYRTNSVSINGGFSYGIFHHVLCPLNVLMEIEFPIDSDSRGTPVIWVKNEHINYPVIVACLQDENTFTQISENQYRIKRKNGDSFVDFFINGSGNEMRINLFSNDKNSPSNFTIKTTSKNKDSIINLFSDSEVNLYAEKKINITTESEINFKVKKEDKIKTSFSYKLEEGFEYLDEFENKVNIKKDSIEIIPKQKIILHDGKEKMVLGDTLKELFSELLDDLISLTSVNCVEGAPVSLGPDTIIKLQLLKSKLGNFLSSNGKLS